MVPEKAYISIPYRQDQNNSVRMTIAQPRLKFQFLIGRIKTPKDWRLLSIWIDFNSLQVGSKRLSGADRPENLLQISIPYRQDQNGATAAVGGLLAVTFQFLIGRIKTECHLYQKKRTPYFNSLQVGSKPKTLTVDKDCLGNFNSLQVGSKRI